MLQVVEILTTRIARSLEETYIRSLISVTFGEATLGRTRQLISAIYSEVFEGVTKGLIVALN